MILKMFSGVQEQRYIDRLRRFHDFYTKHKSDITLMINVKRDENADISNSDEQNYNIFDEQFTNNAIIDSDDETLVGSDSDEDGEYEDTVTGDGLEDKLALLHSSKAAGNTSTKLVDEAHEILKTFLKHGKIDKNKYRELVTLFE